MTIIFQVFCAVFSGILSALAIPNELFHFGSAFFAFIALAPLYIAAKSARSYKACALLFALDALSCHLLSSYWLANFKDFAAFTLGASAFGTACIEAMAGCLFFFPFAKAESRRARGLKGGALDGAAVFWGKDRLFLEPYRILHFAAVRVVYEWAKSTGFLAYPWGVLSMAAFDNKILLQSADIFGAYGLTFLMAFCAGVLGEFILLFKKEAVWLEFHRQNAKNALICNAKCFVLLLLCASCYGIFRLAENSPAQKSLNVALIQQNADPWAASGDKESIKISMELSEKAVKDFEERGLETDLVVWSEAVLRYAFPNSLKFYSDFPDEEPLISFIRRIYSNFVIGGPYSIDEESRKFANAALLFDRTGFLRGWYGKNHLVPFAEVVPGVEYPLVRKWMRKIAGFSNGWTANGTYTLFELEGQSLVEKPAVRVIKMSGMSDSESKRVPVRIAVPICFEDAFPDICGPFHDAGAELFINITDDSWSKTKSAEYQHFAVAVFRTVEYRTSMVRATNAGVTAVVDNKGRVLESIPLFEKGWLAAQVPIYARKDTVHSRFTNWLPYSLLSLLALLAALKAWELRPASLRERIQEELAKIEL